MKKDEESKREMLKFEIDQLRKCMMIYALESIALTFICEVSYILLSIVIGLPYSPSLAIVALIIPLGFFIYMCYGNLLHLRKIKELEKHLYLMK